MTDGAGRTAQVGPAMAAVATGAALPWHGSGLQVRRAEPGMQVGQTVHVGGDDSHVAPFSCGGPKAMTDESYRTRSGLTHIAVVVDDLAATEARIRAAGHVKENHADHEPGERFRFPRG